jgi:hypothetical protein
MMATRQAAGKRGPKRWGFGSGSLTAPFARPDRASCRAIEEPGVDSEQMPARTPGDRLVARRPRRAGRAREQILCPGSFLKANLLETTIGPTIGPLHRRGWSRRRLIDELGVKRETVEILLAGG